MRKTLFFHIGHFKTGTTALQLFLASNPEFLTRNGLEYALAFRKHAKHSALAYAIYRAAGVQTLMHGYDDPTPPEDLWPLLFDYVRACEEPKVVISSEEFMRLGAFAEARAMLPRLVAPAKDIDIRVIAYLREPRAHLRSWYNQLVKMGQDVPDFNSAVCHGIESIHLDYAQALRPWIETFGADNVIVRPYPEPRRSDSDLIADFLSVFGVALPEQGVSIPRTDPNPRLDDRVLDLVRLMQNAGIPQKAVRVMTKRAIAFFDAQDRLASGDGTTFEDVIRRSREGLSLLKDLPHSTIDPEAFGRRLPEPDATAHLAQTRLAGFLISELSLLRRQLDTALPELAGRLDAVEAQLAKARKDVS